MSGNQKISNPKDHFTILPNMYDDADLTVHEFRLLIHYRRVGNCYEAVRTTAKKCHMSMGSVVKARTGLENKGWIKVSKSDSQNDTIKIVVLDLWTSTPTGGGSDDRCSPDEHLDDECSPGERGVHQVNGVFTERTGCSPDERKKYLLKSTELKSTNQEDSPVSYDQTPWVMALTDVRNSHYRKNPTHWQSSPWAQTWVVAGSDGHLVIGCMTEDDAAWLTDRGSAVARSALTGVLGRRVDVEFLGPVALKEVMADAA